MLSTHGRGIYLVKTLMDEVSFEDDGLSFVPIFDQRRCSLSVAPNVTRAACQ